MRMDGSSDAVIRSRPLSSLAASLDGSMLCVIMSLLPLMSSPYNERGNDRLYEPIDEQDFIDNDEDSFVGTGYTFVTSYENLRRFPDLWTSRRCAPTTTTSG